MMTGGASPRMRGWTLLDCGVGIDIDGFPAHAGMDPLWSARPRACTGLPRACGDGPLRRAAARRDLRASPRMRGWTPV